MPENQIENAVQDALESQAPKTEVPTKEEPKTETTETIVEDNKPDERTAQALALLDALDNPQTRDQVIKNLATSVGLLEQSKPEQKKTIRTIKQIVQEKLGEDAAFLSDKLGDAIEEVFQEYDRKLEDIEHRREAQLFADQYQEAIEAHKITDEEAVELAKLADELPWNRKTPIKAYLGKLIKLHRSEAADKKADIATKQRQQANLDQRPKTAGVEANEDRVKKGSGKISAREAVEAALRGERLE